MIERYELFSATIAGIHRSIQKIEADEMVKYGLKGSYAQYLAFLRRHSEGLTLSQLSELCMKDKAAVSRAISEMEEKDLVTREGVGDNMYRAALTLTEQGKKAAEYVAAQATAAVELVGLSDEKRDIFYEALMLISSNLKKVCRQGLPEQNV